MIRIRKSSDRGHANHGWLDTFHSFSFDTYHDPTHMGFRSLRVINEDRVAGGGGFPPHPHRDMEIITYILAGALEHRDNMGNQGVIRPGEVQRMSAGAGVVHSEFNHSPSEPVHLLQIWIRPQERGLPPGYEQKTIGLNEAEAGARGRLLEVASPRPGPRAVTIHQDAALYTALLEDGQSVEHALAPGRAAWIQVARGQVDLNGTSLAAGDGAALEQESALRLTGHSPEPAELLLFDLA